MSKPWARCARCEADLYPRLARRTEEGWACADRLGCGRRAATKRRNDERAEDLAWMAAGGETLAGAAERLGISVDALTEWGRSNGQAELVERLRRNGWAA